jgi:UDP-N-acetylmuramoylalanine--D-glutamate ligase
MMFYNKSIRILGKGKTAAALKEKFTNSTWYDDSDFNLYDKNNHDLTIVSPGIPPYNDMVKNSNNICSDYDLFFPKMPLSIWITGTNGKTTTTQMTQHLLESYNSEYGGNIGIPLCDMNTKNKIWILETSSFTLHYTNKAYPNVFILLPISEDHITWHGSFEEYRNAKLKPLSMMKDGQVAIVPEHFKDVETKAFLITYKDSNDLASKFSIDINKINFKEPFLLDALLAIATQKILFDKIDYEKINTFKVDKHKVEEFKDKNQNLWVDDSKATNIDATINALKAYQNKKIYLILGGDDKGAKLEPLFEELKKYNVELFNIGKNTKRLNVLSKDYNIKHNECNFLKNAVEKIKEKIDTNSLGMLSPAAASLDQYSSYVQRGEEFKNLVKI